MPAAKPGAPSTIAQTTVALTPAVSLGDWLSLNAIYIGLGVCIVVVLILMVRSRGPQD